MPNLSWNSSDLNELGQVGNSTLFSKGHQIVPLSVAYHGHSNSTLFECNVKQGHIYTHPFCNCFVPPLFQFITSGEVTAALLRYLLGNVNQITMFEHTDFHTKGILLSGIKKIKCKRIQAIIDGMSKIHSTLSSSSAGPVIGGQLSVL